jgi:hypothetical protein
VLAPRVVPHFDNHALADRPMFMDDNDRPHRARIVQHFLQQEAVQTIPIARNHGYFCSCIFISQIASCMTSANTRWTIFGDADQWTLMKTRIYFFLIIFHQFWSHK